MPDRSPDRRPDRPPRPLRPGADGQAAGSGSRQGAFAEYRHLHDDATEQLRAWAAPCAGQHALREDLLAHLAAHPGAMAKAGPAEHLTASALVFDADRRRVLLTHHRKAGAWLQLGGHCEPEDPSLWAAAVREVGEESGIDGVHLCRQIAQLDRHRLAARFGRCREHLDVRFVGFAPAGAEPLVSSESLDVRWWPIDALPADSGADLRPLIAAGLAVLDRCGSECGQRDQRHREGAGDLADADLSRG